VDGFKGGLLTGPPLLLVCGLEARGAGGASWYEDRFEVHDPLAGERLWEELTHLRRRHPLPGGRQAQTPLRGAPSLPSHTACPWQAPPERRQSLATPPPSGTRPQAPAPLHRGRAGGVRATS
jgi:hypothetical protein